MPEPLPPERLAAIRAEVNEPLDASYSCLLRADTARRDLLAEVDRLTAERDQAIAAELRRLAGQIAPPADRTGLTEVAVASFEVRDFWARALLDRAAELEQGRRTFTVSWAPSVVREAAEDLERMVHALADAEHAQVWSWAAGSTDGGIRVAGTVLTWTHLACLLDTARAVVAELDPEPAEAVARD